MRPWTSINLKVVERAGRKLQDMLCKSDPWSKIDCKRENCFTCESAMKGEKVHFTNCRQRSVTYETWCETCKTGKYLKKKKSENILEKEDEDKENEGERVIIKKEREKEIIKGPIYRYIGESSRSTYERGSEHLADLEKRRPRSHLLRHCVEVHEGKDPDEIDFRMKQLRSHTSAFERQLYEAVLIEEYGGPLLMNSRIEYNRCFIPTITVKRVIRRRRQTLTKKERNRQLKK